MKRVLSAVLIGTLLLGGLNVQAQCTKCSIEQKTSSPQKTASLSSIDNLVGNYPNKINLIFSDIDGTLLRFDRKQPKPPIPEQLKQSIIQLKKANIPLVLITGRSYYEAKGLADEMGNDNIFIATHQGGEIRNKNGVLIYSDVINNTEVMKINNSIKRFKKQHKINSGIYIFSNRKLYSTETAKLPYNWEPIIKVKSLNEIGDNFSADKIVINESNPTTLRLIQSYLKKKFPKYKIVLSADCYCDISSPNVTKGNAVKRMAELFKVDLKNVAVFGDAENDVSMLKLIQESGGLAISVKNAMPELKEYANYETLSVYDCGFSYGVDKILKNNARLNK